METKENTATPFASNDMEYLVQRHGLIDFTTETLKDRNPIGSGRIMGWSALPLLACFANSIVQQDSALANRMLIQGDLFEQELAKRPEIVSVYSYDYPNLFFREKASHRVFVTMDFLQYASSDMALDEFALNDLARLLRLNRKEVFFEVPRIPEPDETAKLDAVKIAANKMLAAHRESFIEGVRKELHANGYSDNLVTDKDIENIVRNLLWMEDK